MKYIHEEKHHLALVEDRYHLTENLNIRSLRLWRRSAISNSDNQYYDCRNMKIVIKNKYYYNINNK